MESVYADNEFLPEGSKLPEQSIGNEQLSTVLHREVIKLSSIIFKDLFQF